jgi:hypothetical protein
MQKIKNNNILCFVQGMDNLQDEKWVFSSFVINPKSLLPVEHSSFERK